MLRTLLMFLLSIVLIASVAIAHPRPEGFCDETNVISFCRGECHEDSDLFAIRGPLCLAFCLADTTCDDLVTIPLPPDNPNCDVDEPPPECLIPQILALKTTTPVVLGEWTGIGTFQWTQVCFFAGQPNQIFERATEVLVTAIVDSQLVDNLLKVRFFFEGNNNAEADYGSMAGVPGQFINGYVSRISFIEQNPNFLWSASAYFEETIYSFEGKGTFLVKGGVESVVLMFGGRIPHPSTEEHPDPLCPEATSELLFGGHFSGSVEFFRSP